MARDSGGTYSLFTPGNPVVTGTVISSSWANSTLSDLATAMTDSLARSGQGGMLASLKLFAGTIGTPGLSWTAETTSGLYRAGAGDFRFAIGGVDVWKVAAGGVTSGFANGTAALPSISFNSDLDTGLYRSAADIIGVSTAGVNRLLLGTNSLVSTVNFMLPDGNNANPIVAFSNDPDTGIYRVGANTFAVAAGGSLGFAVDTTSIFARDGLVATPAYTFLSDADTGLYLHGVGNIGVSVGGVTQIQFVSGQIRGPVGSIAVPSYSFIGDEDTGMYYSGTNTIGFSGGGVFGFAVDGGHAYLADGTVSLPSLTFSSDNNTGMYRIGADRLGLTVGGVIIAEFSGAGVGAQVVLTTPALKVNGIHNGTAPTGAASQFIASGTYTPTASASVNLDSITPNLAQWIRVGNVVTVSGRIDVDATAVALTSFAFTLPIASNIANSREVQGVGSVDVQNSVVACVGITGNAANDTADFTYFAQGTAATAMHYTYTYLVL